VTGPVEWSGDGIPSSPRYQDIYHSRSGALAQARHVFLAGNGLPARWRGPRSFCILETGFGLGLNFLATWQAWRDDPARCPRLHYVSIEAHPVQPADILRAVEGLPELAELSDLARELAARHPPTLPGLLRLVFPHQGCELHLTLALGDAATLLPQLVLSADAVYLDGFSPARNPELWSLPVFKGVARLMRDGGTAATWSVAARVRQGLTQCGFVVEKVAGLPPKRDALRARYAPAWPRPARWPAHPPAPSREVSASPVLVIGAGLAGACVAHRLAASGHAVTVLEAGPTPASGASGLPAGLMVPHVSPDDAPMSRLTRAGAQQMLDLIQRTGLDRRHWRADGALQMVDDARKSRAPEAWAELGGTLFSMTTNAEGRPARHFTQALAIEPAALVRHLLRCAPTDSPTDSPTGSPTGSLTGSLTVRVASAVARLERDGDDWLALDAKGVVLGRAPQVVLTAALGSAALAAEAPGSQWPAILRAVRGQVTLGQRPLGAEAPPQPLSGDGHFIAAWDDGHRSGRSADGATGPPWHWMMGASFERGETVLTPSAEADAGNLEKLRRLSPTLADAVADQFGPTAWHWVQVRCASPDRLPLVGEVPGCPGLHLLAALGSRGLSLAAVCAELLASQIDAEPWPLEHALGQALAPARFSAA
jgi:tRNA 5-methylaminomethyl-2-thiouridine biosynthesis bifunctional protein